MKDNISITEALIGFAIIAILFVLGGLIETLERSMY